jgi:hypothetical protein
MEATKKRALRPGHEFDALIPKSLNRTRVVDKWATTDNTVKLCLETIRKEAASMKPLAERLRGATVEATCRAIWNWVYQHVGYERDTPGYEQIRTPARSWADRQRGVDCDDYSVLIGSLLLALNIPFQLRVTAYKGGWQHIYPIVPKSGDAGDTLDQARRGEYIVLDDVTDQYDYEVRYTKKKDYNLMQLESLSGFGAAPVLPAYAASAAFLDSEGNRYQPVGGLSGMDDPDGEYYHIEGLGFFKRLGNWIGEKAKAVGGAVKQAAGWAGRQVRTAVTTPIRLGMLAYMKLNVKGKAGLFRWAFVKYGPLAAKAGIGPDTHKRIVESVKNLKHHFTLYGGNFNTLRMAILTGNGNKDRLVPSTSDDLGGLGALLATDPDWAALERVTATNSVLAGIGGIEKNHVEFAGLGDLGAEPVTSATVIAAAIGVISKALSLLGDAKANDPNDPIPAEYQEEPGMSDEEYMAQPDESQPVEGFFGAQTLKKAGIKQAKGAKKPLAKSAAKPAAKPTKNNGKRVVTGAAQQPGKKPVVLRPASGKGKPVVAAPVQPIDPIRSVVNPASATNLTQQVLSRYVPATFPSPTGRRIVADNTRSLPAETPVGKQNTRPTNPRRQVNLQQVADASGAVATLIENDARAVIATRRAAASPLPPSTETILADQWAEQPSGLPAGQAEAELITPDIIDTRPAADSIDPTGGTLNLDPTQPEKNDNTALYVGAGLLGVLLLASSGGATASRRTSGGLSGTRGKKTKKGGKRRAASRRATASRRSRSKPDLGIVAFT